VTLRVGDQLVGVRPDTDATAERIRTVFAAHLEPAAAGEPGATIPSAFSLRLETTRAGRGPRPVPQLRLGQRLLARSRDADDVIAALDHVLGGVLARQDDTRRWVWLRTFAAGGRAVLVDATPPALTAEPILTRAGVTELATWVVATDGETVHVPAPLTAGGSTGAEGAERPLTLVGLVGFEPCYHATGPGDGAATDAHIDDHHADDHTGTNTDHHADDHHADDHHADDHHADQHPDTPGAVLARFGARHPSSEWFQTVERLVADGAYHVGTDRGVAAERIASLLTNGPPV